MSKRACVFVDGENLRHTIVDLFESSTSFQKSDYLPPKAEWAQLFDWLVNEAVPDHERVRTYWYVTESIAFRPWKIPGTRDAQDKQKLKVLLGKTTKYCNIDSRSGTQLDQELTDGFKYLTSQREKMEKRFKGWRVCHEGICRRHKMIEFRPAGSIAYDLITGEFSNEKAVDVKLAVDLLELRNIYDTAIIVSGDQDYVPAVGVIKDSGKKVVNVVFKKRNGELLPGGARKLNQVTDYCIEVEYLDFLKYLNITTPSPA